MRGGVRRAELGRWGCLPSLEDVSTRHKHRHDLDRKSGLTKGGDVARRAVHHDILHFHARVLAMIPSDRPRSSSAFLALLGVAAEATAVMATAHRLVNTF